MILSIRLHTGMDYLESMTLDELLDMADELISIDKQQRRANGK